MFIVDSLGKKWPNGVWAFREISATFQPGTITALIGRNGSGKTTFLRTLVGLYDPDEGAIDNPYGPPGLLLQQPSLWPHLIAIEQVALPLRRVRRWSEDDAYERAKELFSEVNMAGLEYRYPDQLSGGQQQRVAFARTLAMGPKVICLDEVTSSLDPAATAEIYEIILNLRKMGYLVIISTHDLYFVRHFVDEVIYIENGRIRSNGAPKLVFNDSADPFFSVLRQRGSLNTDS